MLGVNDSHKITASYPFAFAVATFYRFGTAHTRPLTARHPPPPDQAHKHTTHAFSHLMFSTRPPFCFQAIRSISRRRADWPGEAATRRLQRSAARANAHEAVKGARSYSWPIRAARAEFLQHDHGAAAHVRPVGADGRRRREKAMEGVRRRWKA